MPWIKYDYDCRFDVNSGKSICDTPNIEVEISYWSLFGEPKVKLEE
jgi:hypothetical protein